MSAMSWLRAHPSLKRFLKVAIVIAVLYGVWWGQTTWRSERELDRFEAELNRIAFPPGYVHVETVSERGRYVRRTFRITEPPRTANNVLGPLLTILERHGWRIVDKYFLHCLVDADRGNFHLSIEATRYFFREEELKDECPWPAGRKLYLEATLFPHQD